MAARPRKPFASIEDFARATELPKGALTLRADADAFRSLGLGRRSALWAVRRLPSDIPLPSFESASARECLTNMLRPTSDAVIRAGLSDRAVVAEGTSKEFMRAMFIREATGVHDAGRRDRIANVVVWPKVM